MPIAELREAINQAKQSIAKPLDDSVKKRRADEACIRAAQLLEAAQPVEVTQLLQEDPKILRTFAWDPAGIEDLLIKKSTPEAINTAIQSQTQSINEKDVYPGEIMLYLLAKKKFRHLFEALIMKADMNLLMEQQRKMPFSPFLMSTNAIYNEYHEKIFKALERSYHDSFDREVELRQKALYGLVSMSFTMPNFFSDTKYMYNLAYNNLDNLEKIIPILKAHQTSTLKRFGNRAKLDDIQSASGLIMAAEYLSPQINKPTDRSLLITILDKLNKCAVPDTIKYPLGSLYHLKIAEILGDKSNLSIMSEKQQASMLKNALNHAELARDTALYFIERGGAGGRDKQSYENLRNSAEKIIVSIRTGYQGKFSAEEDNAKDILKAIEKKIKSTNWKTLNKYPDNMSLMLKEIDAAKKGILSQASALRNIEENGKKAASQSKYMRRSATQEFYQAMSTSKSRNAYLGMGLTSLTRHRDLLFSKNDAKRGEQPASPGNRNSKTSKQR